uniref:Uncharacterized protein n=1 Tax=Megaselia scalaris TaxID=36166 RepID=T1GVI8_MEGSC
METAFSSIQFIITSQHFHHGKMKIRCAAHIHDVYWQTTEKSIEEDRHLYQSVHGNTIDFMSRSYDSESSDENNYLTDLHIQADETACSTADETSCSTADETACSTADETACSTADKIAFSTAGDVSSLNAANNTSETMGKLSRTTTIVISLIFIAISQVLVKIHLSLLLLPSVSATQKQLSERISSSSSASSSSSSSSATSATRSVRKMELHQFINS